MTAKRPFFLFSLFLLFSGCDGYFKNDYKNNSPTSGLLKVYYDEGLAAHVKNQVYTFESLYPKVHVEVFSSTETEAIQALYNDSCEAIVITRLLNAKEKKAFASKMYFPNYSLVAKTGVAVIANSKLTISKISFKQIISLFNTNSLIKDSLGEEINLSLLFDRTNSAVLHYMLDSILKQNDLPPYCTSLNSSIETINYVAKHTNAIGFIDFANLSDMDDSIYIANLSKIKILGISSASKPLQFEWPSQSSFKLNSYPLTRSIYVLRKTGDFTLAKGFESFVAGPKGQLVFLKQGLLPNRQAERMISVSLSSGSESEK